MSSLLVATVEGKPFTIRHLNSITHEGKVLVFVTSKEGKIYYTVKQDGFEDSALADATNKGWEGWKEVEFPEEDDDPSVIEKEKEELTVQKDRETFILRSRYRTKDDSEIAPVQLVSGLGHLYVFRQSKSKPNTLLVDRFVLDGMTNKLVRKLDVRFKRSRQKHRPINQTNGNRDGLKVVDSLDFRDANGKPFFEPTTELSRINYLYKGWFAVVLLPTNEHDKFRWHIFAYNNQAQMVEVTSIRASKEGLFDVRDEMVLESGETGISSLIPRQMPGIIKQTLTIKDKDGKTEETLKPANGLAATKYDIQVERQTKAGPQLLRENTRVMLAIPTSNGNTAAFSFAVAADGTLSRLSNTPAPDVLRSDARDILLPLNTLDEIKAIGDTEPPPQGTISAIERGEEDRVKITSAQTFSLQDGDVVKIEGTSQYNGLYTAINPQAETFEVQANWNGNAIGNWQVVPKEDTGLVFDGMITGYEQLPEGNLKVTAFNHGLEKNDATQILGTKSYDGIYPVTKLDDNSFSIPLKWKPGETVNVKLASQKRRGICLDGVDDSIQIPPLELTPPLADTPFGQTYSAWVWKDETDEQNSPQQMIIGHMGKLMQLVIENGKATLFVQLKDRMEKIQDPSPMPKREWVHYAGLFAYDHETKKTKVCLCKNGEAVLPEPGYKAFGGVPIPTDSESSDEQKDEPEFIVGKGFSGKLSDVQIWDKARTPQEIKNTMYLQLTGKEIGLAGYWRVGAIVEEDPRRVVDFSVHGNDGIVSGEAFVSAVTLSRTLGNGSISAVQYVNDELIAVSQRATYEESFEFRIISETPIVPQDVPIFSLSYWGKKNRSSQDRVELSGGVTEFRDKGKGWYQASCTFTVPDGITLIRLFGISEVNGNWRTIEIRKHRIRLVSDTITETTYAGEASLETLADGYVTSLTYLKQLEQKEPRERTLLIEKGKLEKKLADFNNQSLKAEVKSLGEKVEKLKKECDELEVAHSNEVSNPLNYWCRLKNGLNPENRYSADCYFYRDHPTNVVVADKRSDHPNDLRQQWKFEHSGIGDYYYLKNGLNPENGYGADCYLYREHPTNVVVADKRSDHPNNLRQLWKLEPTDDYYYLKNGLNPENGYSADCYLHREHPTNVVVANKRSDHPNNLRQLWKLEPTEIKSNDKIKNAEELWIKKQTELRAAQTELSERKSALNADTGVLNNWKSDLESINQALAKIRIEISRCNTQFIEAMNNIQTKKLCMPELSHENGLVNYGALLGFVRPLSHLIAIETCEGNVQLSYFDKTGRMRQTNFDAAADTRNTTFEQWIPDSLRTCLNFDSDERCVLLEDQEKADPIGLGDEWTIEAWFSWPLPETKDWNTLTRGKTPDHHIIVNGQKDLGTYVSQEGGFKPCGYNMETLAPGWHHLTAVGRGIGENATTTFYINGQQVGEPIQAKVASDIYAIGNHQDGAQPFGKLAELRIWGIPLSKEEIAVNSKTLLSGNEPGLLAYFPMNEGTGTIVRDHSGNHSAAATVKGGANWWACAAPIGHPGHRVMQLGGGRDSIEIADHPALKLSGDLTVQAWVYLTNKANGWVRIVGKGNHDNRNYGIWYHGDKNAWLFQHKRDGKWVNAESTVASPESEIQKYTWYHLTGVVVGNSASLYLNGEEIAKKTGLTGSTDTTNDPVTIGSPGFNGANCHHLEGRIAEVRLWKKARTQGEIQGDMQRPLTGSEPGLVGYWPLNQMDPSTQEVSDLAGNHDGTVDGALIANDYTVPLVGDALVSTEYSTIGVNSVDRKKMAMMRRFLAVPAHDGVMVLPDKRIEALDLRWIGNAQFAPTLLGYIEGAPPVPSENLTVEAGLDYNGATSVQLSMSEDVAYSWNREQEAGFGLNLEVFVGGGMKVSTGFGVITEALDTKAGFLGNLSLQGGFLNSSNISASAGQTAMDKLELRGAPEHGTKFAHLGPRFIPKNVGYALVTSGLADVYVTKLRRSGKMIGYQVEPSMDVPIDVNTITFLINPAYTMNGSLDGLTGSAATSDRFYRHVPEMRAQYGSQYPASYYRLKEAYDLKRLIEREDKRREAYFLMFNSNLVDETSLDREIDKGPAPQTISVDQPKEGQGNTEETDTQQMDKLKADLGGKSEELEQEGAQRQRLLEEKFKANEEQKTHATAKFAQWQIKMERLQVRAAKRNIVNTYVWDGDGGWRAEAQEFAGTVEHTVGSSFNLAGAVGGQGAFKVGPVAMELTAQATIQLTQTMTKTQSRSEGWALDVDLSGVEHIGITDHNDFPLMPGEKVDRYRFMSFFLEKNTNNFYDFFNYVVDPEWLQSNDEEARALRQAMHGKVGEPWRVLHRVTYVERPALMGFGRDIRKLGDRPWWYASAGTVQETVDALVVKNQELDKKVDEILNLLQKQTRASKRSRDRQERR